MSFKLRSDETLRQGTRRLARQQIDAVIEELTRLAQVEHEQSVHHARKACKKLRALLRLLRPAMSDASYNVENACFRDAAQPLAKLRDAYVMLQTLQRLTGTLEDHAADESFETARCSLQDHLRHVLSKEVPCATILERLRAARKRVKDWADVPNRWHVVGEGLGTTYRRARRALYAAVENPTSDTFHDWRKQIKYLLHQLQVLKALHRKNVGALTEDAERLSSLLGEDHDLSVLRETLLTNPNQFRGDRRIERLLALIDRRRSEVQQLALAGGVGFLEQPPKDFRRAMRGYWKRWRHRSRVSQAD